MGSRIRQAEACFVRSQVIHAICVNPDILRQIGVFCCFKLVELLYAVIVVIGPFVNALSVCHFDVLEFALRLLTISKFIEKLEAHSVFEKLLVVQDIPHHKILILVICQTLVLVEELSVMEQCGQLRLSVLMI